MGKQIKTLLPAIVGLVCARVGLIASTYGSYTSTDENMLTDGPMLVTIVVLFVGLLFLATRKRPLPEEHVKVFTYVMVTAQALSIFALNYVLVFMPENFDLHFALSISCTLTGSLCIFFWLRSMRMQNATRVAVFAFGALALSEIVLFISVALPDYMGRGVAGILAVGQYPCMFWLNLVRAHNQEAEEEEESFARQERLYYGFGSSAVDQSRYLVAMALGVGSLSLVIGVLRGYPDGAAISFMPVTRFAYGALAIALSLLIIWLVLKGRHGIVSIGIFAIMEVLACSALVLYAAFPNSLDIGAVATTTLNALMVGFTWYIIVVFMTHGWRDPYYYAFGGWIVWLGCRAAARVALLEFNYTSANDLLACAVLGGLIVFSTQVVFIRLLGVSTEALDRQELVEGNESAVLEAVSVESEKPSVITRIMGLDEKPVSEEPLSLSDMREQTMRHCAEEMGGQFLLSAREIDVLALYVLGYTQKRVAEELYISKETAHAHIKRIYTKTNMHSRQELIDYLEQYTG